MPLKQKNISPFLRAYFSHKKAATRSRQSLLPLWALAAANMVCVINKDRVDEKKECLVNIISSLRGSTTVKANTVYSLRECWLEARECRLEGHERKKDFRISCSQEFFQHKTFHRKVTHSCTGAHPKGTFWLEPTKIVKVIDQGSKS